MSSATETLLAPRADVWSFLAEPFHLSDWWPGVTGVEPDRRGFAPGARWKVLASKRSILLGTRRVETLLVIGEIEPFERWTWHLVAPGLDVEVRLHAVSDDRTEATVTVSGGPRALARVAVKRLYDLVQTAATL